MKVTNSSFSIGLPDLVVASFRANIEKYVGVGSTSHIDEVRMLALVKEAESATTGPNAFAIWGEAFPLGSLAWPQAWLDEEPVPADPQHLHRHHQTMLHILATSALRRGWRLFQSSRTRSIRVSPFAYFTTSKSRSSAECEPDHGIYVEAQDAAVLWVRLLDCRKPFCTCHVAYCDKEGLEMMRNELGWNIRPLGR